MADAELRIGTGFLNTSGPIVINGKSCRTGRLPRFQKDAGCFISAYDAQTGKAALEVLHRGTAGGARRRDLGHACRTRCAAAARRGLPAATIPS